MRKIVPLIYVGLLFLSGCTWMPRADVADYSSQKRVLSAEHWGELAKDVVSELDRSYLKPKGLKRVYINPGRSDSAFDRAYQNYLTRALMNIGYEISKVPTEAAVVNFEAETFLYSDKTKEKWPFSRATFWATIYAFSDEIAAEITTKDALDLGIVSVSAVYDLLSQKNEITDAEVLITTRIETPYLVEYLAADEFYIDRNDLMLYWSDKAPVAPRIQGQQANVKLNVVNMRIVP